MRNPNRLRTESTRTPKASRAGALYLYSTLLNSTPRTGVARLHSHLCSEADSMQGLRP